MTSDDHISAATKFAEANGIRYAYRRFGRHQEFRCCSCSTGAVTDGLAAGRPVVLFDNAGVAASSGQTPETMEASRSTPAARPGTPFRSPTS